MGHVGYHACLRAVEEGGQGQRELSRAAVTNTRETAAPSIGGIAMANRVTIADIRKHEMPKWRLPNR